MFCDQFFNLGVNIDQKIEKSAYQNLLMDWKVENNFQLFDWWTAFPASKFLKLKIIHLNFWIDRKIVINFHINGNYPSQKINWKKYEYFKKSNFIQLQKPFSSWNILALGYWGIRSIWANWTQIPKWAGIHRKYC